MSETSDKRPSLLDRVGKAAVSTLSWGVSFGTMISVGGAGIALSPVVDDWKVQYYATQPGMGLCVWLTGSRVDVIRDPEFDPNRVSVFCQNHVSIIDGHLACQVIPHRFCGIMNHWHFNVPGYGWIMTHARGIAVYPKKSGRTAEMAEQAKKRKSEGISILAFPEGHRTLDGSVGPFKRGIFFMARDAGIPVVALAVRGIYDVNRKGSFHFNRGKTIEVYIGKQFETAGLDDKQLEALAAEMRQIVANWVEGGQLPAGVPYKPMRTPVYNLPSNFWSVPR